MAKKAFLSVVIGSIIAGLTGLFVKNISAPATSIAFVRTGLPTIILAIWMVSRNIHFFRGNYPRMLIASCLNAIRMYLFLVAFIYTSITQAVIMLFTWPIFVNILSSVWLKEKIHVHQILILFLSFFGIIIIYSEQPFSLDNNDFIGMSAGIVSAIFYATSFIIYKTEIDNYHRNEVIFYQNFIGALVFLPFFIYNRPFPGISDLSLMGGYAILMGIVIFNFFFFGLKYLKASQVSLIAYIEILSAVTVGVLFMDDHISPQVLIGGLFIITSISLLKYLKK
ncbi:MAG: EamA family transporter [Saprospiraceae bacterium]|nr:EamA family transporter [Saprospiraceae bacterium]